MILKLLTFKRGKERGKTVDVTGWIKEYNGRAEVILKDTSQIKIIK